MAESEYLYRVIYNGNKIFEGDEDNAKLMFKLINKSVAIWDKFDLGYDD